MVLLQQERKDDGIQAFVMMFIVSFLVVALVVYNIVTSSFLTEGEEEHQDAEKTKRTLKQTTQLSQAQSVQ